MPSFPKTDFSLPLFQIEDDSDNIYIPLQRPTETAAPREQKEQDLQEEDPFSAPDDSSGESDSDDCFNRNKKQKTKRTVLVRSSEDSRQKSKFKKYQIWATTLEEDLTENMRGIGVAHHSMNDRSVETYDYNLKYRLEGRKRHLSDNEYSEESDGPSTKRCKSSYTYRPKKRPVKERLGRKNSSESSDIECEPRILTNLTVGEDDNAESVSREIAYNLFEEKDDLIRKYIIQFVDPPRKSVS